MRVQEADIDRIRVTVPRPARVEAFLLLTVIAALAIVPIGWYAVVTSEIGRLQRELEVPPPVALQCSWDTLRTETACADVAEHLLDLPSLADVYLARRIVHRAALLPSVFEAPPPVIAPLRDPWPALVADDQERRLIGHILRDAGAALPAEADEGRTVGWLGRDPVLGVPLGGKAPDDATTLERAEQYAPELPDLPELGDRTPEELAEAGVIRSTGGGWAVSSSEILVHMADRAADDVVTYARVRSAAVEAAVQRHYDDALAAFGERRTALDGAIGIWQTQRKAALPAIVGAWGVAALLLLPLSWLLRRRLNVTIDLHSVTIGETRLLWEILEDLTWTRRRVTWRLDDGSTGSVRELALSHADVRVLERTSTAVWLRDHGADTNQALRAIQQLVDGVRRNV